ncbi:MAG: extracellular solute-binding protein [Pseudomonadota bacterium]|nr:extracellular solute-binding protein [Gallaecimonas pentaromativorans]MED5525106.1 extracellular solute-binding protein [Pseudomonadota bacterium]
MKMLKLMAVPLLAFSALSLAHEVADPSIVHNARDGVVRLYGAGGPHTAFKKVAAVFTKETGIPVEINGGPESSWSKRAQANADILWGTAEEQITAMLETYKDFDTTKVEPIYLRPAVIAVRKGNPKHITGFADLLKPGMRIVVTEGAGVANTSGTGSWEDIAGSHGSLAEVKAFRNNIVGSGTGSGAAFKKFNSEHADAWITWPNWPITHPDELQLVKLAKDRTVWRDVNVVMADDADPSAKAFLAFLTSDRGAKIMKTEGWVR